MEHPALQYEQDGPKLSHAFLRVGVTMSILLKADTFVSIVLNLLIFMGLHLWFLSDHLVLILSVVYFLEFLDVLGGVENWTELPPFHGIVMFCLLSSSNSCIFCLKEGKGITVLLHGVKIVDSCGVVLPIHIKPLTVLIVNSTSTMSVSKLVLMDLKMKSHTRLISIAISVILNQSY